VARPKYTRRSNYPLCQVFRFYCGLLKANVKGINLPIIGNFYTVPPRSAGSHVSVRIASMTCCFVAPRNLSCCLPCSDKCIGFPFPCILPHLLSFQAVVFLLLFVQRDSLQFCSFQFEVPWVRNNAQFLTIFIYLRHSCQS
jgi:hypothetical protein